MPATKEGEPKPIPESCNLKNLEERLEKKKLRLPRRIAAHIRDLKQQGKFEEAMSLRKTIIDQKNIRRQRQIRALDELHRETHEMICTDDPVKEAVANIKIAWLFNALDEIQTVEERNREINEILNGVPSEFLPQVEAQMPGIRNEMVRFMPAQAPKPLAG